MPHLGHIKTHNFSVPSASPNCFFIMISVDNIFKLLTIYGVFLVRKNNNIQAFWSQGTLNLKKGAPSLVNATALQE